MNTETRKEYMKEYGKKYRKENKEQIDEKNRKWHEENPDKNKEYKRKYRENNRDTHNAKNREYYYSNIEKQKEKAKRYYENNREKVNERHKKWMSEWNKNNPKKAMFTRAQARARRKGIEFNITLEDITIPTHCPIFGLPLFSSKGKKTINSPSLDRIDNNKGYIKGNIIVISEKANSIKNIGTPEELIRIGMFFKSKIDNIRQQEHTYGYYE